MPERSFASRVKSELCKIPIEDRDIAMAECCGILWFANTVTEKRIRLITESREIALRASVLLKLLFGFDFDKKIIPLGAVKKYTFTIDGSAKLETILETLGYNLKNSISLHLNAALVENERTRAGFLRGAFLSAGSVSNPESSYHLEIVTPHYHLSRETVSVLSEMQLEARVTVRKSNYLIYFKESGAIEDFLTAIGAPISAMSVMEAKMYKELRNSVNRRVNFETANIDKSVEAANAQLDAIALIEKRIGMSALPESLREAAILRCENPQASLSELAEIARDVSKSGLNHRYRKLLDMAEELRKK